MPGNKTPPEPGVFAKSRWASVVPLRQRRNDGRQTRRVRWIRSALSSPLVPSGALRLAQIEFAAALSRRRVRPSLHTSLDHEREYCSANCANCAAARHHMIDGAILSGGVMAPGGRRPGAGRPRGPDVLRELNCIKAALDALHQQRCDEAEAIVPILRRLTGINECTNVSAGAAYLEECKWTKNRRTSRKTLLMRSINRSD